MKANVNTNKKNQKKANNKPMKSLIIVDVQYDFCNPDGALYVKDSEKVIPTIIDYVTKHKEEINQIIFTRDWHLKKDESFKKNGGEWPVHCVQGTDGAAIDKTLYSALVQLRIPIVIVNKGCVYDHEEYGAFEHCGTFHHLYPNDKPVVGNCFFANVDSSSGCRIPNEDLIVCGIAGDYCVKETIKNLLKHWRFNISILLGGVASIDDGTKLDNFIKANNLKVVE